VAERDVREIQGILKNTNSGLSARVVRNLGDFTVALLGISNYPESLELAGTGTLLTFGGAYFILTASHVWERKLKPADHVGITLKPNVKHMFGIPRGDFIVFGLPKPKKFKEWGPDLMLLRIPAEYVGLIRVHKVFLNVEKVPRKIALKILEVKVLMGAPATFGKIKDAHADLQITGMFLGPEKKRKRNGFDYLDYRFDLTYPGMPRKFGGVSGGGVWNVYLYYSPETGGVDWSTSLHGVAFYELDIVKEHRPIRCHGPQSIKSVIRRCQAETNPLHSAQSKTRVKPSRKRTL